VDPQKFSAIAHSTHEFCSPVSPQRFDAVCDVMALAPQGRVLDLGCGNAAMLRRLVERRGVAGEGVERSRPMAAMARERGAALVAAGRLTIHETAVAAWQPTEPGYDLVMAIGADRLFPDVDGATALLARLAAWTKPGGHVLFGEGYWRRPPSATYLAALGAAIGDFHDHAGNVWAGEEAGLVPLYATTSSEDEWDEYEWRYARAIERYVLDRPDDPDAPAMRERIRTWRRVYLTEGRETLGFGMYLFLRPPVAD
jgi:SAM-dependent methyltransferase